ncbi:MAG TPA: T9SS type A sorting domain-containing protein [Saprospiraceae bacterium]|nr:T9SS type A sorting domain-containing protein [Saprospiraceae bacterium]
MKPHLTLLLLAAAAIAQAQQSLRFLPDQADDTPPWAVWLYQEQPNVAKVDSAYRAYYAGHDFVKTSHTQYYKKWRRAVEPFVQPDGSVLLPQNERRETWEQLWLEQRAAAPKSNTTPWQHIGPVETFSTSPAQVKVSWQANVYCIDQSSANPDILFCGTEAGGIYKTTNKGLQWTHVSANTTMRAIHSIKIDPANADVVYAGDGSRVYKTVDGGQNWSVVFTSSGLNVNDISVNPGNPAILLVAADKGLYRSTDAGQNWTQLYTQACWDIEVHPTLPDIVYVLKTNPAAGRCEFFKSLNSGATFSIRENGWYSSADAARRDDGARMTVTPADPNVVYVVLAGNSKPGDNGFIGVFRSSNAGESWTLPNPPVGGPWTASHPNLMTLNNTNTLYQGYYNLSIAASHTNADQVLIGGLNLWKTDNGAQTFTALGGYQGSLSWIHPDQQEIKILGNDCWVANDGGVEYSGNFFSSRESRKNGITASDFWGFGSGWNEDLLVGGRYHNGNSATRNTFPQGQFLRLGGGEAPTGYVNPGIAGKAYFSDINTRVIPTNIEEEVLSLPQMSDYPGESYYAAHSSEMEFHPLCYRRVFIGKDNQLWRSEDEGASFQLVKTFDGSTEPVMHFEISRANPDVMYVYQRTSFYGATLWRTADGGQSWQARSFPSANSQRAGTMTLSATDPNTLWVAFGHQNNDGVKVFKTTDGGQSWQNLSTPTLNGHSIQYIFHQAGSNGAVYAGTNFAVFYRDDSMSDWEAYYEGLPASANCNIIRPFYKENKLRMATYSHGIWETDLKTPSATLAQPMADKLTAYCARDTFYFEDYSVLRHAGAAWQWAFPGAAYVSDATARNPKVVFGQTGVFDVSLTITDAAGQSSTKTVPGMIRIETDGCSPDTIPGEALRLGGATSDFAVGPALHTPMTHFTISAWIKREGPQPAFAGLFFTRGGNTTVGLNFGNNNELRYHWNDGFWSWNSGLVVPDGEWAHIAMVVEPNRTTLYLNGKPAVNNGNHAMQPFEAAFYLGADPNHSGRRFKGQMEEVCIWNRALSVNEIRKLRHLVKVPAEDPALLAYYQFNETTGDALDRSGLRHLRLSGGAVRTASSCPVGIGTSTRLAVNAAGDYFFGNDTGVRMTLLSGGTVPNGEVYLTRINLPPDEPVNDAPHSRSYWIFNNYGTNPLITPPTALTFSRIGPVEPAEVFQPQRFRLYVRSENADGETWQFSDPASELISGDDGGVYFGPETNVESLGQMIIARDGSPVSSAGEPERQPYEFAVYPNPASSGGGLTIATERSGDYRFTLFDGAGRRVAETQGRGRAALSLPALPSGVYSWRIQMADYLEYGKLVVE